MTPHKLKNQNLGFDVTFATAMQPPTEPKKPEKNPTKAKEVELKVRADLETMKQAKAKAKKMGWSLSSVVRALLRLWIDEDVISSSDVGNASTRAPYKSHKPKRGKRKTGK